MGESSHLNLGANPFILSWFLNGILESSAKCRLTHQSQGVFSLCLDCDLLGKFISLVLLCVKEIRCPLGYESSCVILKSSNVYEGSHWLLNCAVNCLPTSYRRPGVIYPMRGRSSQRDVNDHYSNTVPTIFSLLNVAHKLR